MSRAVCTLGVAGLASRRRLSVPFLLRIVPQEELTSDRINDPERVIKKRVPKAKIVCRFLLDEFPLLGRNIRYYSITALQFQW